MEAVGHEEMGRMSPAARDRALQKEMKVDGNLHPALGEASGPYKVLKNLSSGVLRAILPPEDLDGCVHAAPEFRNVRALACYVLVSSTTHLSTYADEHGCCFGALDAIAEIASLLVRRSLLFPLLREIIAASVLRPVMYQCTPYTLNKLFLEGLGRPWPTQAPQATEAQPAAAASTSQGLLEFDRRAERSARMEQELNSPNAPGGVSHNDGWTSQAGKEVNAYRASPEGNTRALLAQYLHSRAFSARFSDLDRSETGVEDDASLSSVPRAGVREPLAAPALKPPGHASGSTAASSGQPQAVRGMPPSVAAELPAAHPDNAAAADSRASSTAGGISTAGLVPAGHGNSSSNSPDKNTGTLAVVADSVAGSEDSRSKKHRRHRSVGESLLHGTAAHSLLDESLVATDTGDRSSHSAATLSPSSTSGRAPTSIMPSSMLDVASSLAAAGLISVNIGRWGRPEPLALTANSVKDAAADSGSQGMHVSTSGPQNGFKTWPRAQVSASEVRMVGSKEYVAYIIRVVDADREWTITRRYGL